MGSSEVVISGRTSALGGQAEAYKGTGDLEVDIITDKDAYPNSSVAAEDPDATEYSSSFVDTTCDAERGSGFSEAEVESQFFGDSDLPSPYDEFSSIFQPRKKKKLTNHWRNFIRPLMWRCKWTEIKIKEIESQRSRYTRKLATWEQEKHPGDYQPTLQGHCSKSLPFSNPSYKRKAVKRRKRRRVEDTFDAAAYMSDHVIYAYAESKRSNQDGSCILDDLSNTVTQQRADENEKFGICSNLFPIDFKEGDLEKVLRTIEVVQSRVQKLKNELDLVIPKNTVRFSSSENLSLLAPFDTQTSSAPSPTFSACNGETFLVGAIDETQHMSRYDFGDFVQPDGAISCYGETIHVPDIIESTVGLLSAEDVTFHQAQFGDSCENIVDNILIQNEVTDREKHGLTGTSEPLVEGHHLLSRVKDEDTGDLHHTSASEVGGAVTPSIFPKEEPGLQSSLHSDLQLAGSKRKRGERKAGSVGWSKKSSDDPDSQ